MPFRVAFRMRMKLDKRCLNINYSKQCSRPTIYYYMYVPRDIYTSTCIDLSDDIAVDSILNC